MELVLTPVTGRSGFYAATLDGRRVVPASRQPFHDGARALLAEGAPSDGTLAARHAGSFTVAMRATVVEGARWTVEETDDRGLRLRPWRPCPMARRGGAGAAEKRALRPGRRRGAGRRAVLSSGHPRPARRGGLTDR